MKRLSYSLIIIFSLFAFDKLMAQTRQGGGQGFNPAEMIEAEKKAVLDRITTLTEDQKEVIEIIYTDYTESFGKAREKSSGDFQVMRTKIVELRAEKDKSLKEVLTEDQYKEYIALMEEIRQRRIRGN
jgi:hypothetical protein